jgi:hypothetical protein
MTDMSNSGMTISEFERLLDVYGGDRTRWPAEARAAAGQLVARDASARRIMAEAEALDRVLERAPLPSLAIEAALAERILAAAQRSPRIVKMQAEKPVSTPQAEREAVNRVGVWRQGLAFPQVARAAVLAASLVGGVFLGISNLPEQVLPGLAGLPDRDALSLAQVEPFDEEVL